MSNPFLRNLELRDSLSAEEREIARSLCGRTRIFPAKADIVSAGTKPRDSCLMLSGFSARYTLLGDGRRQITAVHCAGEFVDLHSLLLSRMDHSVLALSECEIALVPHELLRELSQSQPHLTRLLWMLTVVDAACFRQWLVAAGRLSSVGQVAHFLCEIYTKLTMIGLIEGPTFRLPLNQTDLSDAMGLSIVHVNRTLQLMRKRGLIEWQGEVVRILDFGALRTAAQFDPTYLDLVRMPR